MLTLLLIGLSFRLPAFYLPALLFLLITAYFAYAWWRFSPQGGNVQAHIVDLLLARLDWDGQGAALDIGCGNGPLAIKLACRFPHARATGIDYWGKNWDYSQSVCEGNARAAGVGDRLEFRKASASELPFPDESFDLAVSNLVFHEVSQVKDKRQLVGEALRVVKRAGVSPSRTCSCWKPTTANLRNWWRWSRVGGLARWNSSKPAMSLSSPGCSSCHL